jgi:hypothetical protein
MKVYITVNETYYGGYEMIAVFRLRDKASEYISNRGDNLDWIIIEKECSDTRCVWLVVSEEWYGGEEGVRVFTTPSEAETYISESDSKLDRLCLSFSII